MEEKKITLRLTEKQIETIYIGLLELPGKYSLTLIKELQDQVANFKEVKEA